MEFMSIVDQEIYDAINPPANMSYEVLTEKIRQYILENKDRTEEIFAKHLNRIMNVTNDPYRYSTAIGVLLTLAKMMANVKIQNQPLHGIPPASNMDFKLAPQFSDKLKKIAIDSLNNIENEYKETDNLNHTNRAMVLQQEIYLFSEGKMGKQGPAIQNNFQRFGFC